MIAEERAAFMRAVCERNEEKVKPRKERRSAQAICKEINTMYNTNICEATVRRKSSVPNLSMEQCLQRGRKPNLKEGVDLALSTALATYIQLSNAAIKKMPNRRDLIMLLKATFKGTPNTLYTRYDHLFDRIMKSVSNNISVNPGNCKIEHRR